MRVTTTTTLLPPAEYLIALSTRLRIAAEIASGSAVTRGKSESVVRSSVMCRDSERLHWSTTSRASRVNCNGPRRASGFRVQSESVAWEHQPDGTAVWTQYWENGRAKGVSTWRRGIWSEVAPMWDPHGSVVSRPIFRGGFVMDGPSRSHPDRMELSVVSGASCQAP